MKKTRLILAVLIGVVLVALLFAWRGGYITPETVITYIEAHPRGAPVLYVVINALLLAAVLPIGFVMTLGAGALWGTFVGGIIATITAMIGGTLSFYIARYIAADYIKRKWNKGIWKILREEVEHGGWKSVVLARLSQVIPFSVQNYIFGVTALPFKTFIIVTVAISTPSAFIVAALGSAAGGIVLGEGVESRVEAVFIGSFAVVALIILHYGIKRYKARTNAARTPDNRETPKDYNSPQ